MEDLKKCSIETSYFSLSGYNTCAKVVDVIDGDTVVIVVSFMNTFLKFNCRLINIDTCEVHSRNEKIKEKGLQARNRVIELLSKQIVADLDLSRKDVRNIFKTNCCIVFVKCFEFDKYGRLLVDIYEKEDDTESISTMLVKEKLAYVYTGATKLTEDDQLEILK